MLDGGVTVTLVDLPTGSQLDPYDPCSPGAAFPAGVSYIEGNVYVVLGNLNPTTYAPAGNSFLVGFNDFQSMVDITYSATLTELPGCQNGWTAASAGSQLMIPCAGNYADAGSAVLFDPTANAVVASYATGGAPTFGTVSGTRGYLVDALGGSLMIIDVAADGGHQVVLSATQEQPVCPGAQTLSAVASGPSSSQILGTCSLIGGSDGGNLVVLNADGSVMAGATAPLDVGPVDIAFLRTVSAATPYDLFGVVNTTSDDVQFVSWPSGGQVVSTGVTVGSGTASDLANAISSNTTTAYVVLSATAQLVQIDLTTSPPSVKNTAQLPTGSNPYYVAAIDGSEAWVSLLNTNQMAIVRFP